MSLNSEQLVDLNLKSMTNQDFTTFMTDSYEAFAAYCEAQEDNLVSVQLGAFSTDLSLFRQACQPKKKSVIVNRLLDADQKRLMALRALKAHLNVHAYSKEVSEQEAYQHLIAILGAYKVSATKSYENKTAAFSQLLKRLAEGDAQSALQTLDLTIWVVELRQSQENFERLYDQRLEEQAKKVALSSKEPRGALSQRYHLLVTYCLVMMCLTQAEVERHEAFTNLRDHLNTIRKRYRKRKGTKASSKDLLDEKAVTADSLRGGADTAVQV